jgi:DNA repair protein SbcC/Rad50
MFFDRLLKKRRPAVAKTASQASLTEIALGHEDPAARLDAVRHLASLAHLREILAADGDAGVREIALGRYRNLLSGVEEAGVPLPERLAEIALVGDPRILEHLAVEAREAETRLAAIECVTNPAVLVHCVLHDPRAANRVAALGRLEDRDSLEHVVRRIGKKDTGVYREARDRLRRMAEQEDLPRRLRAQCAELCERAEGLGRLEHWSQDRALLDHLDSLWAPIEAQAEPIWRERYQAARERFLNAYEAHRQANAAQIAAQEARAARRRERESLLAEARGAADQADETTLADLRERLAVAWADLDSGPPDSERAALDRRFEQALGVLDSNLERLAERRKGLRRLERLKKHLAAHLAESSPLDHERVRAQIAEARALAQTLPDTAGADVAGLADQLDVRLKGQREDAERRLNALPDRLTELEGVLDGGELKRAEPLHQAVVQELELARLSGLPGARAAAIGGRLRALSPRLKELQHWRRWGANQHRTALCEAMEALRDQDLPLAAVAERLHVLQADWKGLDPSGAPANRALWNRFQQAREAVYERCRPYLEAEAAEREANRAAREAVCRQLEDFLARVDWTRVDWRRVMHAERETRQAWASIGPTDDRQRRPLDRRFHRAIKELDQRLETERARNQAFKQGLIDRVRGLAEGADLDAAIEETKGLQRQWHTTVPARQREENRLWQEFRAACDAVFERRAALHQAHRAELDANLRSREALCEEAEALIREPGDARSLAAALRDLEHRWHDAESLPLPRQASGFLSRRWQQACEQLRTLGQQLEAQERRGALDLLGHRAALCESVERQVLGLGEPGSEIDLEGARRTWSELPPLPDPALQGIMTARLDRALEAVGHPEVLAALREGLDANQEVRRRLCLELEIAAGVESPPELNQERLRLQVERLAERMAEGEGDRLKGVPELLADWYRCGPAPADPRLDERVGRVLANLAAAP